MKQRDFVAEEVITEVLSRHQRFSFPVRGEGFSGEDREVICFSWRLFL